MEDVEPFIEWLREQGLPAEHITAYRAHLDELAKHPSLSAAIRAAEEAGTPARQIANMRQVAARLAEFKDHGGRDVRGTPRAPVAVEARSAAIVPALEIETRRPRSPSSTRTADMAPLRTGCSCRRRHDIYLDNDFGALARLLGGGIGIGTLVLIRLIGVLGAAALALGLAGMGGLITTISICFRCEGCRQRITDLDEDERAHLRKGRGMVVLVTAGLLGGAAVCGYLWYLLMNSSRPDL